MKLEISLWKFYCKKRVLQSWYHQTQPERGRDVGVARRRVRISRNFRKRAQQVWQTRRGAQVSRDQCC